MLAIECPVCHRRLPAIVVNAARTLDGSRLKVLEAECQDHGMFI
jgi:uncharacterized radical SAM superfamily Fe-S cluster-containing enzyme